MFHERGSERSERASERMSAAKRASEASNAEQLNEWVAVGDRPFWLRGVRINQNQIPLPSFCSVCVKHHYFEMNVAAISWLWPHETQPFCNLHLLWWEFAGAMGGFALRTFTQRKNSIFPPNIYRDSNRRFRTGWTDGQTKFTVMISHNAMSPLTM